MKIKLGMILSISWIFSATVVYAHDHHYQPRQYRPEQRTPEKRYPKKEKYLEHRTEHRTLYGTDDSGQVKTQGSPGLPGTDDSDQVKTQESPGLPGDDSDQVKTQESPWLPSCPGCVQGQPQPRPPVNKNCPSCVRGERLELPPPSSREPTDYATIIALHRTSQMRPAS
jgi:hypothetical protein